MTKAKALKQLGSLVSERTLAQLVSVLKRANKVVKSGKRERVTLKIKSQGKPGITVVQDQPTRFKKEKDELLAEAGRLLTEKGLNRLAKNVSKIEQKETQKKLMKRMNTWNRINTTRNPKDFISIKMTFEIEVFFGKDNPSQTIERTVEDYGIIEYQSGVKSSASFEEGLNEAYDKLKMKFLSTLESNSILVETLYKKHWILSQNELLKHTHDPNLIKMRVSVPTDYKFITGIELNKPINKDECVSDYILSVYKKKIPSLTKEKIDEIMFDSVCVNLDDSKIDVVLMTEESDESGRTAEQIQKFCDYYKISHYAFDVNHNLFIKKTVTPKSSYPAMMYYCIDGHLYPLTDPATRKSITSANAGKTITHSTSLTYKV